MAITTNPLADRRIQTAHLLRRVGFGGTPQEIDQFAAMSHTDAVDKLLTFTTVGTKGFDMQNRMQQTNFMPKLNDLQYWWLTTMLHTPNPFQEKMTLFWHGHFTTAYSKTDYPVLLMEQNELFRNNALGNFKDLTKAVSRNVAMVYYLDGEANHKTKPNENYARELMELFTIGIGNYTEQDVREAARAFSGWGIKGRAFYFNPNDHDTGSKTFMGQTGNFGGDEIIDIILKRPESARFIIGELWNNFVYPNPEPAVLDNLTKIYFDNNYELKPVLRAMLTSPEFLSDKAYRALVKSPTEFIVGSLRQLNSTNISQNAAQQIGKMGQTLFSPPTVKGWDGGIAWFNSSLFFERVNGANQLVTGRGQTDHFDPYPLIQVNKLSNGLAVVDYFLGNLMDGQFHPDMRSALLDYFDPQKNLSANDLTAPTVGKNNNAATDERLRGLVHLILSSPDYQLK